ncbi:MAG: hypothetical protein ABJD11_01710 [Gemmatimonadota bacterium]
MPDPGFTIAVVSVVAGTVTVLLGPLGKSIGRMLEGPKAQADAALMAELDELRARLENTEQLQARLHDVEERLDFTERVLARQREQARLSGEAGSS